MRTYSATPRAWASTNLFPAATALARHVAALAGGDDEHQEHNDDYKEAKGQLGCQPTALVLGVPVQAHVDGPDDGQAEAEAEEDPRRARV